jgi:hypothetical protein
MVDNEQKGLDKKTLERIGREWDKLPRGKGSSLGSVAAVTTENGDVAKVVKNGEVQIITGNMNSDLN